MSVPTSPQVMLLNPECAQGRHANCDRHTWHDVLDERTACRCSCHTHASLCEYLVRQRDCTCPDA